MENAPVITVVAYNIPPQEAERYRQWVEESYYRISLSTPWVQGNDRYKIVNESPDYPKAFYLQHYPNMDGLNTWEASPERAAIRKDQTVWHREVIWSGIYEMVKGFSNSLVASKDEQTSLVDDASILHIEAFNITSENAEKYNTWFSDWGQKVYIPILMKLPGIKAINCYRWTGRSREPEIKDPKYPRYVSLMYFESYRAYEIYKEGPELVALRESIKWTFPGGLDYRWNIQYQLVKSWRK